MEWYWYLIIWGSLLVPCIGGWTIILVSSIMYYAWRGEYPNKAKSINLHGWLAWAAGQALAILLILSLKAFIQITGGGGG